MCKLSFKMRAALSSRLACDQLLEKIQITLTCTQPQPNLTTYTHTYTRLCIIKCVGIKKILYLCVCGKA